MSGRIDDIGRAVGALRDVGLLEPRHVAALTAGIAWWGPSVAALYAAGAHRHPQRHALVDDEGALTYGQIERRTNRIVRSLRARGVRGTDTVGILCRNGRGFVMANVVASKLGAAVVYLNTGFAGPQIADVARREGVTVLIHDAEFAGSVEPLDQVRAIVADEPTRRGSLLTMGRRQSSLPPLRSPQTSSPVLLTSGTTGTPKGARRSRLTGDLDTATAMFQRMPYRTGDRIVIAAPLFHAWGLSQLTLAATLGGTAIVRRRFDPLATIDAVATHRAQVLAVVPVMLRRILDAARPQHQLPTLQITASSGSALPGELALEWLDRFGANLYNLYGSTEVGQVSMADPDQLRAHPGTAGSLLPGTTVRLLDPDGREVPAGSTGEIHVGSSMLFDGYTGGGTKDSVDGLMSIGDVGYLDDGLLHVTGRADDMIVSGGENVFPREVEDLLDAHPGIVEAAVHGVPDEEFGQRLRAVVVARADLDADAVRAHVAEHLARYKVPRDVAFVEELPRNATGKLLRSELPSC